MFETNFEYTEGLLNKISKNSAKTVNIISELLMMAVLASVAILFVTGHYLLGGIFAGVFVAFFVSLILTNRSIRNYNKSLLGHKINIVFNEESMTMKAEFAGAILYNLSFEYDAIKRAVVRDDLVYVYFNKKSAIIIPKTSFTTTENYEKAMHLINNNYMV